MARPVQVAVAREMISPRSNRNISLQLNMGEGKSSVIVPLVASTLADGSNLLRVVTLKPFESCDSQTSFKPDVPTSRQPALWPAQPTYFLYSVLSESSRESLSR
jgi:hypothetical protein